MDLNGVDIDNITDEDLLNLYDDILSMGNGILLAGVNNYIYDSYCYYSNNGYCQYGECYDGKYGYYYSNSYCK